jgi:hypothetical protein
MQTETKQALAAVCCLMLALTSCTSNASRGAAGPREQSTASSHLASTKRDPCQLITKEEVEAALKAQISEVVTDGNDCTYRPIEGSFKGGVISVEWEQAEAAMTGAKAGVKMIGLGENVDGVGDEAVFMPPGVLYVRKGDVFMSINLYYTDNALDKEKALAQKAFSRL